MSMKDEWDEGDALRVITKEEARALLLEVEERMARLARERAVTTKSPTDPIRPLREDR